MVRGSWPLRRRLFVAAAVVWCIVVPPGLIFRERFADSLSIELGYAADSAVFILLCADIYFTYRQSMSASIRDSELDPIDLPAHMNCEASEDICPICLENDQAQAVELDCGHRFHRQCVEQALAYKMECPTCRAYVDPENSVSRV